LSALPLGLTLPVWERLADLSQAFVLRRPGKDIRAVHRGII